MEKYLGLPATPISFQCPFVPSAPLPSLLLGPKGGAGPPFLPKLPKSSAMYYVETNKIEETMTSSRLSPAKSDKRGRSAPSFSAPCRPFLSSLHPADRRAGWGKRKPTFLMESLPRWTESPQEVAPNCVIITLLLTLPCTLPTLCSSSNSHALPFQGLCGPLPGVFPSSDFKEFLIVAPPTPSAP